MQSSVSSKLVIILNFIFAVGIFGQQSNLNFKSPVNHKIVLAGSFGEIRSTHFHAGIDIKPSSTQINDDILCSDIGYVSRIKVQRGGYGRALYIDHPNGYTTVYAHLSSLDSQLQSFVQEMQRNAQSFEIDIYPEPGQFIYNQGDKIGEMGNSGRSYGQHLHYEIRETLTEYPVNPMQFGIGPNDHIVPTIQNISIYGLSQDFEQIYRTQIGYTRTTKKISIPAWRVGIGVQAYDQMDGAANRNGIYETSLYVDDTLYYHQQLSKVDFNQMNQIKAHVDYESKINNKSTYALTYKLPGNNLDIIDSIRGNGLIPLFKDKPRNIRISTKDIKGNSSSMSFYLIRDNVEPIIRNSTFNLLANYNKDAFISASPISLTIPAYTLAKNEKISIASSKENEYIIGRKDIAILSPIRLSVKHNGNTNKLILAYIDDNDIIDYGSIIEGDSIIVYPSTFGLYKLYQDTIGPNIKPIAYPTSSQTNYTFNISDNVITKGHASDFEYDVYINDQWVACEYKEMTKTLYISKTLLNPSDRLLIKATDHMGNTTIWKNR